MNRDLGLAAILTSQAHPYEFLRVNVDVDAVLFGRTDEPTNMVRFYSIEDTIIANNLAEVHFAIRKLEIQH